MPRLRALCKYVHDEMNDQEYKNIIYNVLQIDAIFTDTVP